MPKTKFTIRVDADCLAGAQRYAGRHGTTVSRQVAEFFARLSNQERPAKGAPTPVLQRLAGILPGDISPEEHDEYLKHKYGT